MALSEEAPPFLLQVFKFLRTPSASLRSRQPPCCHFSGPRAAESVIIDINKSTQVQCQLKNVQVVNRLFLNFNELVFD